MNYNICQYCRQPMTTAGCGCFLAQPFTPYDPYRPYDPSTQMGWQCPRCRRVYAPFVPQCTSCGPATGNTVTTDSTG